MSPLAEELDIETYIPEEPKFSHYADSVSVTEGYITGKAVVAICGKVFVPSRDPKKFPICPICKELAEALFLGEE